MVYLLTFERPLIVCILSLHNSESTVLEIPFESTPRSDWLVLPRQANQRSVNNLSNNLQSSAISMNSVSMNFPIL